MMKTAAQHLETLRNDSAGFEVQVGRALAELSQKRDAYQATVTEAERLMDKYPALMAVGHGRTTRFATPEVNSRVNECYVEDYANTDGNSGSSEIVGAFYIQDGASRVYSLPHAFEVGYYSYDDVEGRLNISYYDDWKVQARTAGISDEMIEGLERKFRETYRSEE